MYKVPMGLRRFNVYPSVGVFWLMLKTLHLYFRALTSTRFFTVPICSPSHSNVPPFITALPSLSFIILGYNALLLSHLFFLFFLFFINSLILCTFELYSIGSALFMYKKYLYSIVLSTAAFGFTFLSTLNFQFAMFIILNVLV
jgi:hypothetical protein